MNCFYLSKQIYIHRQFLLLIIIINMLPKRKIIRKQYVRPDNSNEGQQSAPASLFDKLKSIDTHHREEALAYVSSICSFVQGPKEIAILTQLIVILYQGNNSLVHQCLFALANLCEVSEWVTPRLFQMGLDKALIQLNSNDKNLLKPIMLLMIALSKNIPAEHRYLIDGVQASLTADHLVSQSLELVLEFLICTEAKKTNPDLNAKIFEHFNSHEKIKTRSLSLAVLLNNEQLKTRPEFVQAVLSYCQEILVDLNLQNEYKTNLVMNKPVVNKNKNNTGETEVMDEEEEQIEEVPHPNYQIFIDAVEGTELLLEEILKILEGQDWSDEQIDDEGEQIEEEKPANDVSSALKDEVTKFLIVNYAHLSKNAALTFLEGQNIVSLALRLIVLAIIPVPQLNSESKLNTAITALRAIDTVVAVSPSQDIANETFISSLFILLKCGLPEQGKKIILNMGFSVLKIKDNYKDCWIFLLELFSAHFNPEKTAVSLEENRCIGQILKNLIINIPQLQLQQWRAQVIDTLFDVYSNQQYDQTFVQLGFIQILQTIRSRAGLGKKKKFIREVLQDITRFLQYKRKMIKF